MTLDAADFSSDFLTPAEGQLPVDIQQKAKGRLGELLSNFWQRIGLHSTPHRRVHKGGQHEIKIEPAIVCLEERIV